MERTVIPPALFPHSSHLYSQFSTSGSDGTMNDVGLAATGSLPEAEKIKKKYCPAESNLLS